MSGGFKSCNPLTRKDFSTEPTRRGMLRAATSFAAAVALIPFQGVRNASAQKKLKTQEEVKYQPTPKGKQNCANCDLFVKPDKCKSVEGTVVAEGWCKIWVAY